MIDLDVAFDKLAGFETADDIACFLRGYGVKAIPKQGNLCAFAVWMTDITEVQDVVVSGAEILAQRQERTLEDIKKMGEITWAEHTRAQYQWRREHTPAMKQFVMRFDRMAYPDLVDMEAYSASPYMPKVADGYDVYQQGGVHPIYGGAYYKAVPMEVAVMPLKEDAAYISLGYKLYKTEHLKFTDITNC